MRVLRGILLLVGLVMILALAAPTASAQPGAPGGAPVAGQRLHQYFVPLIASNPSARLDWEPGQLRYYRLQEGDDLAELALELGRDVALMACVTASGIDPLSELRPGEVITVPDPHYLCHTVQEGESLDEIAQRYQVSVGVIVETAWNRLTDANQDLEAGQRLLIFGGTRPDITAAPQNSELPVMPVTEAANPPPEPTSVSATDELTGTVAVAENPEQPLWPYGDGHFLWPVEGPISQGYHVTHKAIDIAVPHGTPVLAADNGVVKMVGYSTVGYGGRVVIDHNNDYVTLYAHLHQALVEEGETVQKGQVIGFVGSTGISTGPHLHFELRDFGYLIDPRPLLATEVEP